MPWARAAAVGLSSVHSAGAALLICGRVPGLVADRPSGRGRTRRRDEFPASDLGDAWLASRSGPVAEPGQALGVEPVDPLAHGLHVTAQLGRDGAGAQALPAERDHLRPHDPVGRGVTGPGRPADLSLLAGVHRWTRMQQAWRDNPPETII